VAGLKRPPFHFLMNLGKITLRGEFVSLEPLESGHLDELCEVGLEPELWRWTVDNIQDRDDLRRYLETAMDERNRGVSLPFITREAGSDKIVGSTRFGNIDSRNRSAEIGWTWINPLWQRTAINTEAKLLMLTHAFEVWKCIRVQLKTDALNEKSRNAVVRIGGKEEGTLRRHVITETGRFRDTVFFSIIDEEWKCVKENLTNMLKKGRG
jgi:RimJ/RimL family protein N-acetyltransferase